MNAWVARLGGLAVRPEHDHEERLRRSALTLFAAAVVILSPVWIVTYLLLDRPVAAMIPLAYAVITLAELLVLWRTRSFGPFRSTQLPLIFALPTLLQWSLGGFVNGSAVILWSISAPIAALVVDGRRAAAGWFAAFCAAVLASALLDPYLAAGSAPLPAGLVTAFFALDTIAPVGVTFGVLVYVIGERDRAMAALEKERGRSEALLLNVLPAPVAERLKAGEARIAERHDLVTILFADVVDFTPFAERTPPEEVVSLLDRIFSAFDELADRHGLEKIKTIGDAYMAVAGAPTARVDHAATAAEMALEMGAAARRAAGEAWPDLELRIGLACGPAIAGVIGRRKFSYDLWGDTVNTAGRMESHGIPGRIHVTEAAYRQLRDRFTFEERGALEVKGKGPMRTYLLTGRREPATLSDR